MFADKYMDANQQHSESSSVNFLQEEHAKTLKGLHSEIHKLQQKCASEEREREREHALYVCVLMNQVLHLHLYLSQCRTDL